MQLDIFEHSRDVMLRNAAIDALRRRDAEASVRAIDQLAAQYAGDPLLPSLRLLCERLRLRIETGLDAAQAREILDATVQARAAASRVLAGNAVTWMAPVWSEFARAVAHIPFDPQHEAQHAAAAYLLAGDWDATAARVDTIPAWRRQAAPLAWKLEAQYRTAGLDGAWPFLAELAWLDPRRAAAVAAKLDSAELASLLRRFDAEFEGNGEARDFAWFPAWWLVAQPARAVSMRLTETGSASAPERCARLLLNLLLLERQGRHGELIEGRKRLRDAHPFLFRFYMQSR